MRSSLCAVASSPAALRIFGPPVPRSPPFISYTHGHRLPDCSAEEAICVRVGPTRCSAPVPRCLARIVRTSAPETGALHRSFFPKGNRPASRLISRLISNCNFGGGGGGRGWIDGVGMGCEERQGRRTETGRVVVGREVVTEEPEEVSTQHVAPRKGRKTSRSRCVGTTRLGVPVTRLGAGERCRFRHGRQVGADLQAMHHEVHHRLRPGELHWHSGRCGFPSGPCF